MKKCSKILSGIKTILTDRKIKVLFTTLIVFLFILTELSFAQGDDFGFEFDFAFGSRGIGRGKFDNPVDIAEDSDGNLYVIDQGNSRIQKFDADGEFIMEWGRKGANDDNFNLPTSIHIVSEGKNEYLQIVDSINHRVSKYDLDGTYIGSYGELGARKERFNAPNDIGIDINNNIYVADSKNDRIQKFSSNWVYNEEHSKEFSKYKDLLFPTTAEYVKYKYGFIYVSSIKSCNVIRFELDGKFDKKIEFLSNSDSNVSNEDSEDVDEEEDTVEEEVPEEEENIDSEETQDEAKADDSENTDSCGIKRLKDDIKTDTLLIIFNNDNAIYQFDYDGKFIAKLTEGKVEFNYPTSILVTKKALFVVDGGNNYIHKFKRR